MFAALALPLALHTSAKRYLIDSKNEQEDLTDMYMSVRSSCKYMYLDMYKELHKEFVQYGCRLMYKCSDVVHFHVRMDLSHFQQIFCV